MSTEHALPADLIPPEPPPAHVGLVLGASRPASGGVLVDGVLLGARYRRGVLGVELAGSLNPAPADLAPVDETIGLVMGAVGGGPWAATTRVWGARALGEIGPSGAREPADPTLADWDAGRRPWGGPRLLLGGEVRGLQGWTLSSSDGETLVVEEGEPSLAGGPVIGAALALGYGDLGALRFVVLDAISLPTATGGLEHAWSLELGIELERVLR